MEKYIGTKLIEASEMTLGAYNEFRGWKIPEDENPNKEGYLVKYSDCYVSWSPKEIFDASHMKLSTNKELRTDKPSVSQDMVDNFIESYDVHTLGSKTTVVRAVLKNGFEIVESSSCVSAENYDEKLGAEICLEHVKNKIWMLLGFLLQTAVKGTQHNN